MFAGFPNQSPKLTMVWSTPEVCRARKRRNSCSRSSREQLGSFSTDGDGNGNDENAMGLSRKTTLHVHHAFLCISLPSLHDCENAWFHALWRTSTSDHKFFFLFLKFECSSQEINSREIGLVTFSADWNKRDNVFQSDVFAAVAVVDAKVPYSSLLSAL